MNSVGTDWIAAENPVELAARRVIDQRFRPALDAIDGGARIVAPIITGFNTGTHVWGQFLKDYRPTDWCSRIARLHRVCYPAVLSHFLTPGMRQEKRIRM